MKMAGGEKKRGDLEISLVYSMAKGEEGDGILVKINGHRIAKNRHCGEDCQGNEPE